MATMLAQCHLLAHGWAWGQSLCTGYWQQLREHHTFGVLIRSWPCFPSWPRFLHPRGVRLSALSTHHKAGQAVEHQAGQAVLNRFKTISASKKENIYIWCYIFLPHITGTGRLPAPIILQSQAGHTPHPGCRCVCDSLSLMTGLALFA